VAVSKWTKRRKLKMRMDVFSPVDGLIYLVDVYEQHILVPVDAG
jgi:hypothetical protein